MVLVSARQRPAEILTAQTLELVEAAEQAQSNNQASYVPLRALVHHLRLRCDDPAVRAKYQTYLFQPGVLQDYPLDEAGYAQAFDPLHQEAALYETWQRYGVVVARNVVADKLCANAVSSIGRTLGALSQGRCNIARPNTYRHMPADENGVPLMSRGFFEVYHEDELAQLRQAIRLYLHHVIIWGRADLWTTFDRYGVKLPGHPESAALPLHVDQNPNVHAGFKTTQGVLALQDCPAERGTLVVAPGSKTFFGAYGPMAQGKGEYVELDRRAPIAASLARHAQPLPLRKGSIATWDSRTTHANTANVSRQTRFVALISAGPARPESPEALEARRLAFSGGMGSNVREALMHASKRPRYTNPAALAAVRQPEDLTLLGRLLYGEVAYDTV